MTVSFIFVPTPGTTLSQHDFNIEIKADIQLVDQLFAQYEAEGKFPGYFGHNWDALLDCLRDFSWVKERRIVIVHYDLPLLSDLGNLKIYLDVLDTAVQDWKNVGNRNSVEHLPDMSYVEHELKVIFPLEVRELIIDCQ